MIVNFLRALAKLMGKTNKGMIRFKNYVRIIFVLAGNLNIFICMRDNHDGVYYDFNLVSIVDVEFDSTICHRVY
jgi:hypothetical protein